MARQCLTNHYVVTCKIKSSNFKQATIKGFWALKSGCAYITAKNYYHILILTSNLPSSRNCAFLDNNVTI